LSSPDPDQPDLLQQIDRVLQLTAHLATVVAAGEWDEAERTEIERLGLLDELSAALVAVPPDRAALEPVLERMQAALALNEALVESLARERGQVARELRQLNNAAQAEREYRSHFDDSA
jgi:hypothetical protein